MKTAKLIQVGQNQAVILPKNIRFDGEEVLVKRVSNGILLMPSTQEGQRQFWEDWYTSIPEVDVPLTRTE